MHEWRCDKFRVILVVGAFIAISDHTLEDLREILDAIESPLLRPPEHNSGENTFRVYEVDMLLDGCLGAIGGLCCINGIKEVAEFFGGLLCLGVGLCFLLLTLAFLLLALAFGGFAFLDLRFETSFLLGRCFG